MTRFEKLTLGGVIQKMFNICVKGLVRCKYIVSWTIYSQKLCFLYLYLCVLQVLFRPLKT